MRALEKICECILSLLKIEDLMHHGPYLLLLVERNHLLKAVLGAIQDPFESDIPSQSEYVDIRPIIRIVHLAGQIPDAINQAAPRNAVEALFERFGAARFEYYVRAMFVGHLDDVIFPLGLVPVVDSEVGAQGFGLGKFLIGRGGDYHCEST